MDVEFKKKNAYAHLYLDKSMKHITVVANNEQINQLYLVDLFYKDRQ